MVVRYGRRESLCGPVTESQSISEPELGISLSLCQNLEGFGCFLSSRLVVYGKTIG